MENWFPEFPIFNGYSLVGPMHDRSKASRDPRFTQKKVKYLTIGLHYTLPLLSGVIFVCTTTNTLFD